MRVWWCVSLRESESESESEKANERTRAIASARTRVVYIYSSYICCYESREIRGYRSKILGLKEIQLQSLQAAQIQQSLACDCEGVNRRVAKERRKEKGESS